MMRRAARGLATTAQKHTLPTLKYEYGALEPFISGQIMEIHHAKHHQTYVTNLNKALEQLGDAEKSGDVQAQIALQGAIRFNGGGHVNHSIFWENLAPQSQGGGGEPEGPLRDVLLSKYGSFDAFKTTFNTQTAAVQGSGWGWLVLDPKTKNVEIMTMPNQDPVAVHGKVPLLGIDVWEHAYYLQYKNVRPDYLNAIWNVVNWNDVQQRYAQHLK